MDAYNKTLVKEFILVAFSDIQLNQILLFIIILLMYIVCISGNITIICLVKYEPSLHKPMYIFISVFAFLEIMFVSVITMPKLLANLLLSNKQISYVGCFSQLYIFNALGETECYLLAIMAFDRHLAINNPLRYTSIMNLNVCSKLAFLPWIIGFSASFIPTMFTASLEFCGPNVIDHFFCDLSPVQNLACSNPFISNIVTIALAFFMLIIPFIMIIAFYIRIIITISRIKTSEGKLKAFSTCSFHLIVASLFYGTCIIVYVRPKGSRYDKFLALTYTIVTPLLNPFVYTLRNKDVKDILKKKIGWILQKAVNCQTSTF
ncbi:hypothetical protein XELAEV_18040257mg [Xenopus laevis]|uniref:Olfactory receptor n=1 Tax=Xenopus laevis TaxID=8355 RepID=A0A974C972_XENLA|nr:hypothetical protein XELAEV_18040257mg [Xenopus laevis]